jgi:hypothetical protein
MRLTRSWVLAGLAIGIPALMIALFSIAASRSPDGGEAAGFVGLLVVVLGLFVFVGFGAWALAFARPGSALGRGLRRAGLAIAGLAAFGYGLAASIEAHYGVRLFLPVAMFLLAAAAAAFYALVTDLWPDTKKTTDEA